MGGLCVPGLNIFPALSIEMESQFSQEGARQRDRMQKRLKELKGELDSQRSICNDNPSYVLKRAISSVKYYTGQLTEADTILLKRIERSREETEKYQDTLRKKIEEAENNLQERIEKLREETDNYKKTVQTKLEESQDTLEREKTATPARVVSAEHRYNRVLEEYIKLGFETEKEKLARESSESQFYKLGDVASQLSNSHNPPLENRTPVVCVDVLPASPSNFPKPDLEIPLTKPILRHIELSETITNSQMVMPISQDEADVIALRKIHNPNSRYNTSLVYPTRSPAVPPPAPTHSNKPAIPLTQKKGVKMVLKR